MYRVVCLYTHKHTHAYTQVMTTVREDQCMYVYLHKKKKRQRSFFVPLVVHILIMTTWDSLGKQC